jgi:hypothetical protein
VGTFLGTAWVLPIVIGSLLAALTALRDWATTWRRFLVAVASRVKASPLISSGCGLFLLLSIPLLFTPLVDSDGLRYHMALPKAFALAGKVFLYPWDLCGAFPQAGEMLYLVAYLLGRPEAAKFLHFLFFLGVLANLLLAVHRTSRSLLAAWISVVFFLVSPVAVVCASGAFIDHMALFHLTTAALLILGRTSPAGAGAALGAATATKLTAGLAGAVLAIFGVLRYPRPRKLATFAALALIPVAVFSPFGLRNLVTLGDPFYPTGYALLGKEPPGLPPGAVERVRHWGSAESGPLGISWTGSDAGVREDEVAGTHLLFGLFCLAFAARWKELRLPLAIAVVYIIAGMKMHPPARLLLPFFLVLASAAGIVLARLPRKWATTAALVLAIQPAVLSGRLLSTQFGSLDYLLGKVDRTTFLARAVPGYRAAMFVNRLSFRPGAYVMALDFPAPFYFDHPWIVEGIVHDPPLQEWIRDASSANEVLTRLSREVEYVLITPGYGGGTPASMLPLARSGEKLPLVAELRSRLRKIATIDGVDIYEVPPPLDRSFGIGR